MQARELLDHRPQHLQHRGARRDDAQRAGDLLAAAARAVQRALQRREAGLRVVQERAAFLGQAQPARGAVEQARAQVRLELRQRLAGGLRRDRLRERGLAQAAQFGRFHEGGDGAEFVEGHGLLRSIVTIGLSINERIVV